MQRFIINHGRSPVMSEREVAITRVREPPNWRPGFVFLWHFSLVFGRICILPHKTVRLWEYKMDVVIRCFWCSPNQTAAHLHQRFLDIVPTIWSFQDVNFVEIFTKTLNLWKRSIYRNIPSVIGRLKILQAVHCCISGCLFAGNDGA